VEELFKAQTPDYAWNLARALAGLREKIQTPLKKKLFQYACQAQEKEDHRSDPFWFLLREWDAKWTRDQLASRAWKLQKKKDYANSLTYWKLVTRDAGCPPELRFELAATGLKLSSKDPVALARQGDPALGQFSRLLQDPEFDLAGHVAKAKWLEVADLFYLGFHFSGETGLARNFGKKILEMVVKKSPRSEIGKNAKRKLKSEGLI
jgi:hypothetical protein